MKQIIYLKITKYIDRNYSIQIIAFLKQLFTFLDEITDETMVYMITIKLNEQCYTLNYVLCCSWSREC